MSVGADPKDRGLRAENVLGFVSPAKGVNIPFFSVGTKVTLALLSPLEVVQQLEPHLKEREVLSFSSFEAYFEQPFSQLVFLICITM